MQTVNVINEVTALSDGTTFTYDSNGNRTQKIKGTDTWLYAYDYANRLTKVEKDSETLGEYIYDGDGRRLQKTEGNETTTYIYFGLDVLYEENTTGTACYIYGPAGRLAKRTTINGQSNTFYYHINHLGSTRLVTDSNKNIVSAVTYLPFGEINTKVGSEYYLFNGKEQDSTGLYYYGARYYDSEIGQFTTRDLLNGKQAGPQTLNRYTYCLNNPLKYTDPWGLMIMDGGEPTEVKEEEGKDPEITGDPYYENGEITVPTTDGDIEVFNDQDGGSWGDWKEKAEKKREEAVTRLENKARELENKARELLGVASSMQSDASVMWVVGLVISIAGLFCPPLGMLGIAIAFYGGLGSYIAGGDSGIAEDYLSTAEKLRDEAEDIEKHGCG